jgi:hypothetical protein
MAPAGDRRHRAHGVLSVVGVVSHDRALPLDALARVGVPLLCAWFAAARVAGTYRAPGTRTLVTAWALAVPVAVLARGVLARGPWDAQLLVFLGVALAFTFLFLVVGRGAARAFRVGERVVD